MKKLFLLSALLFTAVLSAGLTPVNLDMIDCNFDSDINWQRIGDKICNLAAGRYVTATEKITPFSKEYTFEAAVKPLQKVVRTTGDSGVLIASHLRGEMWRMILVDNNKKRFAKLDFICSKPGSTKSRVTIKCVEGKDYQWDYKKSYILRVGVKDGKVTGSVSCDGKVVVRYTATDKTGAAYNAGIFGGDVTDIRSAYSLPCVVRAHVELLTLEPGYPCVLLGIVIER